MCRLYGVTRAGYYAWRERPTRQRARRNTKLAKRIETAHRRSRGLYGSPRIYQALRQQGCTASENRVARVMRVNGIKARVARVRYTNPTLKRYFAAVRNEQLEVDIKRPDQVWVGDITCLKVGGIYRYRAVRYRKPARGLFFHTDRGIEYAAHAFKQRLAELGITQSMNRPGKVTDNAFIESFFHSMKSEIFHGYQFDEDREMCAALRNYLPFYNRARLHSSLHYVSPATYEKRLARKTGVN